MQIGLLNLVLHHLPHRFRRLQYDIHHYEYTQESGDTTFTIELPNDSATTIPAGATAITNYEYEERLLESKRKIRLIQPSYIAKVRAEFETIIGR
jgi:hypothetical protein